MAGKLKILFVDDELPVMQALRRMLHRLRSEWDMHFVTSGEEALQYLRFHAVHVVVADMRMPKMSGAELLRTVREQHPEVVRIILSGYSDQTMVMQTLMVAHQFLIKPCEPEVLRATIGRILQLRGLLRNEELLKLVAGIDHLPSLPNLYLEITRELRSMDPRLDRVIDKIQRDPALSMKVLQLVNSGFFGLPKVISDVAEAARLLGVEILQSVVLFSGIYTQVETRGRLPISYEEFSRHSLQVGRLAQEIAHLLGMPVMVRKEVFSAGILHDMGKLILALYRSSAYGDVLARAKERGGGLSNLERSAFGVTHGELGSYLLDLWGLPSTLVEAVAFHNMPSRSHNREVGTLAAVHLADVLSHWNLDSADRPTLQSFDLHYLREAGLADRVSECISLREEMGIP